MAVDIVAIYNRTLGNLGTRSKVTATNDGRKESAELNKVYAGTLDDLLKMHDWGFARFTALLVTQSVLTAPANWAYVYARPALCLRALYMAVPGAPPDRYDGMPVIPYEAAGDLDAGGVEVDVIYTDQAPAYLRYTRRVTDTTRFPSGFENALCWALAANVALVLTGDGKVAAACGKSYVTAYNAATTANANEGTTRRNDQLPPWLAARV